MTIPSPTSVAVFGHQGFIGSQVFAALVARGRDVFPLKEPWPFPCVVLAAGGREDSLRRQFDAQVAVPETRAHMDKRVLYLSSYLVYEGYVLGTLYGIPYPGMRPSDPPWPVSPYAMFKTLGEHQVLVQGGTVFRLGTVYDSHRDLQGPAEIYENARGHRIALDQVVAAVCRWVEDPAFPPGIHHLVGQWWTAGDMRSSGVRPPGFPSGPYTFLLPQPGAVRPQLVPSHRQEEWCAPLPWIEVTRGS